MESARGRDRRRGRRRWIVGLAAVAVALVAATAFGVFGVHTLFVDRSVAEKAPVFASGASAGAPPGASTTTTVPPSDQAQGATPSRAAAPTAAVPTVREAARGSFTAANHPGRGSVVILTDGAQSFARFEDDFATDNGPDLYVTVTAGGREIQLGRLKGNVGAQNYELPPGIDLSTIERISVWCKRFDSTFTTAELG
ncbi:MAG: DM13 domain-containing protein [Acidimicrobiales bacterium]